jgi:hypothetical protein
MVKHKKFYKGKRMKRNMVFGLLVSIITFAVTGCATTSNKQTSISTTLPTETIYRDWNDRNKTPSSSHAEVELFSEDRKKEGREIVEIRWADSGGPFFWVQWNSVSSTKKEIYEGAINTKELTIRLDNGIVLHISDPLSYYSKGSGAGDYAAFRNRISPGGRAGLFDLVAMTVGAAWKHVDRAGAFRVSEEQAAQIQASNTLELECWNGRHVTVTGSELDSVKRILAMPRYVAIPADDPVIGRWKTPLIKNKYGVLQVQSGGTGTLVVYNKKGKPYPGAVNNMRLLHGLVFESNYIFFISQKLMWVNSTFALRYRLEENSLAPLDNKLPVYFRETGQ